MHLSLTTCTVLLLRPVFCSAWWEPIDPERLISLSSFRTTRVGRAVTRQFVRALEALRVAPQGSTRVAAFLETAADGLVAGGKRGIFTPMFYFLARKPAMRPATP